MARRATLLIVSHYVVPRHHPDRYVRITRTPVIILTYAYIQGCGYKARYLSVGTSESDLSSVYSVPYLCRLRFEQADKVHAFVVMPTP